MKRKYVIVTALITLGLLIMNYEIYRTLVNFIAIPILIWTVKILLKKKIGYYLKLTKINKAKYSVSIFICNPSKIRTIKYTDFGDFSLKLVSFPNVDFSELHFVKTNLQGKKSNITLNQRQTSQFIEFLPEKLPPKSIIELKTLIFAKPVEKEITSCLILPPEMYKTVRVFETVPFLHLSIGNEKIRLIDYEKPKHNLNLFIEVLIMFGVFIITSAYSLFFLHPSFNSNYDVISYMFFIGFEIYVCGLVGFTCLLNETPRFFTKYLSKLN